VASAKRLVFRAAALADVEVATDWYVDESGVDVAARFVVALEGAYEHIARQPTTGSPRWGVELNIAELRAWPLTRYPYLVFYVERAQHVEVWRVLHGARDIPATLAEPDAPAR
jgi:toxin ParE1/3/4